MSVVIIGGYDRMASQYKMARCAVAGAERSNAEIVHCHTSSGSALNEILLDETPGLRKLRG